MKRISILLAAIAISFVSFAQDTISGYSFPNYSITSLNPTSGLAINNGFQISFYSSDTLANDTIAFTNGATSGDYAATATHWDNGMNTKYWLIKFKAPGYTNFTVSSKQRAGGTANPGPKDFKIQWKLNNGIYNDVTNGAITVGNDWTTGVANNLSIPASALSANDTIYVRWILTSNLTINNTNIINTGVSKIDDIYIMGTSTVGITDDSKKPVITIYPNPSTGILHIESANNIKEIAIYDVLGKLVYSGISNKYYNTLNLDSYYKGIYILKLKFADYSIYTSKISVK